jgi:hypothetical protein
VLFDERSTHASRRAAAPFAAKVWPMALVAIKVAHAPLTTKPRKATA